MGATTSTSARSYRPVVLGTWCWVIDRPAGALMCRLNRSPHAYRPPLASSQTSSKQSSYVATRSTRTSRSSWRRRERSSSSARRIKGWGRLGRLHGRLHGHADIDVKLSAGCSSASARFRDRGSHAPEDRGAARLMSLYPRRQRPPSTRRRRLVAGVPPFDEPRVASTT